MPVKRPAGLLPVAQKEVSRLGTNWAVKRLHSCKSPSEPRNMLTAILTNDQKPFMPQRAITDFDIQALVDNSDCLAAGERRCLLETIRNDKVLRKRYDALTRQKELLRAWWDENRPGPFSRWFRTLSAEEVWNLYLATGGT
jgi:hypothetical protein